MKIFLKIRPDTPNRFGFPVNSISIGIHIGLSVYSSGALKLRSNIVAQTINKAFLPEWDDLTRNARLGELSGPRYFNYTRPVIIQPLNTDSWLYSNIIKAEGYYFAYHAVPRRGLFVCIRWRRSSTFSISTPIRIIDGLKAIKMLLGEGLGLNTTSFQRDGVLEV